MHDTASVRGLDGLAHVDQPRESARVGSSHMHRRARPSATTSTLWSETPVSRFIAKNGVPCAVDIRDP